MIFCTYWFLIFLCLFLPLYWLIKNPTLRLALLLVFCAIFHGHFAGAAGVIPIIFLGLITFALALLADRWGQSKERAFTCGSGIAIVVGALVFYKYSHFILSCFNSPLAEHLSRELNLALPATPPLAISFFAFEYIHYLYDVGHGKKPLKAPQEFLAFSIFFPSLVAGPIKRYHDFIPSLKAGLSSRDGSDIVYGCLRVARGFFKKLFLADNFNQFILTKQVFFDFLPLWQRWLIVIALAGRIYFDFSGYTDIAIGIAMMLGIKLPENFNAPYKATSIRDFWQRWHMSLSLWIRDYVYIPLGGGNRGALRKSGNAILAFALCGLWHGASWNFLAWGLYHGAGLAASTYYRRLPLQLGRPFAALFDSLPGSAWLCTFFFVSMGWLLFFYPVHTAWHMFTMLFNGRS